MAKKIFTIGFSTGSYDDYRETTIAAYENRETAAADLAVFQAILDEVKGERWNSLKYDQDNDNYEVEYLLNRFPQLANTHVQFVVDPENNGRLWPVISWGDFTDSDIRIYIEELDLY